MSLLMSIVFAVLVFEMTLLAIMLLPLPQGMQRSLVTTIDSLLRNSQIRVGLSFIALIVSLMFFDAVKTSFPHKDSSFAAFSAQSYPVTKTIGQSIWDVRSKKFYAHRNMYITGAVLYLMVAIYFNDLLLSSIVRNKEKLIKATDPKAKQTEKTSSIEYEKLQHELKLKEDDVATFKRQLNGMHAEYQKKADDSTKVAEKTEKTTDENKKQK